MQQSENKNKIPSANDLKSYSLNDHRHYLFDEVNNHLGNMGEKDAEILCGGFGEIFSFENHSNLLKSDTLSKI